MVCRRIDDGIFADYRNWYDNSKWQSNSSTVVYTGNDKCRQRQYIDEERDNENLRSSWFSLCY